MKDSVAIIGAGRFGRILANSFREKFSQVYVSSNGNLENRKKVTEIDDNIKFRTNQEIAYDNSIKSVVIASPIENLFDLARFFILCGKNVFLEKPGALDHKSFDTLRSITPKNQVLYVDYLTILDPCYLYFKSTIKKETIEEAKFFWEKNGSLKPDILLNLLCHDLSVAYDLFGCSFQEIKKTYYNDEKCKIHLIINNASLKVDIDRSKDRRINRFYVKTKESGVYLWDKESGRVFLNGQIIFEKSDYDLVSISRDKFLNMVNLGKSCQDNLSLSYKILETIGEIRQ